MQISESHENIGEKYHCALVNDQGKNIRTGHLPAPNPYTGLDGPVISLSGKTLSSHSPVVDFSITFPFH